MICANTAEKSGTCAMSEEAAPTAEIASVMSTQPTQMEVKTNMTDVRKRAWKTRRAKYGERGHSGAYCHPQVVYTARWNERLRTMTDALIRLWREGVLSEGQVSKATGIDRVSCRDLASQQAMADSSKEAPQNE
jgi:hypothetical protein